MKILVIGAGAIGCLVGGKLALAGEQVTLVGRPHFAKTIAAEGLHIHSGSSVQHVRAVDAAGSMHDAFAGERRYDLAILTVKSYDTATAIEELRAETVGQPPPVVLSLQNGVGNEEAIAAAFGAEYVIAGTLTTPVSVPAPGTIRIDRPSFSLGLSTWSPHTSADLVAAIHAALRRAGFNAKLYAHAQGMKWTKLLMNMLGNATSAILGQSPAHLFADRRVLDVEIAAWREALAVMRAAQIPPVNLGSYPFGWLAPLIRIAPNALLRPILRRQVAGARGDKMPSLHLDLHAGKLRSEIDWLNGAVVARGKACGVPTPVNAFLTETVTALLGDVAAQAAWQGKPEKLAKGQRQG